MDDINASMTDDEVRKLGLERDDEGYWRPLIDGSADLCRRAGSYSAFTGSPAPDESAGSDGATVLNDVAAFMEKYVAFATVAHRDAEVLWAAHTHALAAFDSKPRLAILSAEKGSGKTRNLEVLELLVPEPLPTVNCSTSSIFRMIEDEHPTLLFDEIDTIFRGNGQDNDDLRGLLNAGHRRGKVAVRCVGSKMDQTRKFRVFSPVALAGLRDLPDTLMDRSVIIRMKRRAPTERVEPFRLKRVVPEAQPIYERLAAWAKGMVDDLRTAEPEMPPGIVDRPADVWEPLLAIADAAGGDWPERGRAAAMELNAVRNSEAPSIGVRLLTDIRAVFFPRNDNGGLVPGAPDRLSSADLARHLCEMEEAPWGDLYGKPLDARGLAKRLKSFDVHPHSIRIGDKTPKGYEAADFGDAWTRYLPPDRDPDSTVVLDEPNRPSDVADTHAPPGAATTATRYDPATEKVPLTCNVAEVAEVADAPGTSETLRTLDATAVALWPEAEAPDHGLRIAEARAAEVRRRRARIEQRRPARATEAKG